MFIDLESAYDKVPGRFYLDGRWLEVYTWSTLGQSRTCMMEPKSRRTVSRDLVHFPVVMGLHQGLALSWFYLPR